MEQAELRLTARAAIRELSPELIAKESQLIQSKVISMTEFANAPTVFTYISRPCEVDTSAIISAALSAGKRVAAPRCLPGGVMDFYYFTDPLGLIPGLCSIKELPPDLLAVLDENDILLLPGLLFTPRGERLGQGGGYYDRWLALHPGAFKAGLSLSCQLCDHLPAESHDIRLDAVISAEKIYYQRKINGNH